jgi:hypothetical protein
VNLTIHIGPLSLASFSLGLFLFVTWFCHREGMIGRDSGGSMGIGGLFAVAVYAIVWACPSLVAVIVWLAARGAA